MKISFLALSTAFLLLSPATFASEFDQYLQQQQIIDQNFKIQKPTELNELLMVLSAEDSRTLPLQIDQNTIIEQLHLSAEQTVLNGIITTPDFEQFEKAMGTKKVTQVIRHNLLNNCAIFFEHEYQRQNPYTVQLHLTSTTNRYDIDIHIEDCKAQQINSTD